MPKRIDKSWYGFEPLNEGGGPPSGDSMKLYLSKIGRYLKDEEEFSKEGFTLPLAKKLISLAQLNGQELYVLFHHAKGISNGGVYLEIGSCVGGSLMCAYEATRLSGAAVNFIAIDKATRKQLLNNTKIIPNLIVIHSSSDHAVRQIVDKSVDLLFIDGDHGYKQIKRDLGNYWPKLKAGGVLLGHDYGPRGPGVVQAVDEKFGHNQAKVLPNDKVSKVFMVEKTE